MLASDLAVNPSMEKTWGWFFFLASVFSTAISIYCSVVIGYRERHGCIIDAGTLRARVSEKRRDAAGDGGGDSLLRRYSALLLGYVIAAGAKFMLVRRFRQVRVARQCEGLLVQE